MADEYEDDTLTRMCDEDYDEEEDGPLLGETAMGLVVAALLAMTACGLAWWS